jgi:glycolate oxidase iron-sulfur subunit
VSTTVFTEQDKPAAQLIDACVHCGFCLPTCPTYALWGEEMDSPRGRIYLMKSALEGRTDVTPSFVAHFDRCLGCVHCVTACPSGVQYGPLLEATRSQIEQAYERPASDRMLRSAIYAIFPHRARMRLALLPLAIARPLLNAAERVGLTSLLPARLRALLDTAPPVTLRSLFSSTPEHTAPAGEPKLKVGLLTGCVQQLVYPEINDACVQVLASEGCEVVAPGRQGCCGALSLHAGRLDEARAFARGMIATFEAAQVDRVVVNAAGCGSAMKEYAHLLKDDPAWAGRAHAFSARVRDVSEQLVELGPSSAPRSSLPVRVAYQDACHLAHAQGVRQAPRDVLASIPGVERLECGDEMCCGSAGVYNLLEPEAARALGERKLDLLLATSPDVIATANPGCRLQLASIARRRGISVEFRHPVELLRDAMQNDARRG